MGVTPGAVIIHFTISWSRPRSSATASQFCTSEQWSRRASSFVQANEKNKFHYTASAFSLTKSHFASSSRLRVLPALWPLAFGSAPLRSRNVRCYRRRKRMGLFPHFDRTHRRFSMCANWLQTNIVNVYTCRTAWGGSIKNIFAYGH